MSKALIKKAEQLLEKYKDAKSYPEAPLNVAHEFITRYRSAVVILQSEDEPEEDNGIWGWAYSTWGQLHAEYPFSKYASDDYKLKWFINNIDLIKDRELVEELEQAEEIDEEAMKKILRYFSDRPSGFFRTYVDNAAMCLIDEKMKDGGYRASEYSNANYKFSYPKVKEYINNQ